jgi:hypothetical protein
LTHCQKRLELGRFPQNSSFYVEYILFGSPLAHLCRWRGKLWAKDMGYSEVLLGTALGNRIENIWEQDGNMMGTQGKKKFHPHPPPSTPLNLQSSHWRHAYTRLLGFIAATNNKTQAQKSCTLGQGFTKCCLSSNNWIPWSISLHSMPWQNWINENGKQEDDAVQAKK